MNIREPCKVRGTFVAKINETFKQKVLFLNTKFTVMFMESKIVTICHAQ
jgi:hypothetical protein